MCNTAPSVSATHLSDMVSGDIVWLHKVVKESHPTFHKKKVWSTYSHGVVPSQS